MQTDLLEVGNKIEMTQLKDFAGKKVKKQSNYTSQLLEVITNQVLKIAMPIDKGKIIPLSVGEEYDLCFYTSKGMYICKAKIRDRYKEVNVFVLLVTLLTDLERHQRRNFFRIDYTTDAKMRVITPDERILEKQMIKDDFANISEKADCHEKLQQLRSEWKRVTLIDLSGGGARIQSDLEYEKEAEVKVSIPMFGAAIKQYAAKVIASYRAQNVAGVFETRLEFIEMNPAEREFLIKCIFQEQRRRVKK